MNLWRRSSFFLFITLLAAGSLLAGQATPTGTPKAGTRAAAKPASASAPSAPEKVASVEEIGRAHV